MAYPIHASLRIGAPVGTRPVLVLVQLHTRRLSPGLLFCCCCCCCWYCCGNIMTSPQPMFAGFQNEGWPYSTKRLRDLVKARMPKHAEILSYPRCLVDCPETAT